MNDQILDIAELLMLQKERPLTKQEQVILDQWMQKHPENALVVRQVQDEQWIENGLGAFAHYDADNSRKILESRLAGVKPVHRIHFLRTAWFRYAAAVLIIFGVGTYVYVTNQKEEPSVTQTNPVPVQTDVAPGGNKATLILADGSKIILDSAANGKIAQQDNTTITKNGDQVFYKADRSLSLSPLSFNTMSTPRGGQYQLTLPDGSQVWLNAESSITYPTTFGERERERRVSVTGEVYFEVAKNKAKPFIISISPAGRGEPSKAKVPREALEANRGGLEIQVLGTHFNVNSYKEEQTLNTTLLEGSIRLTTHYSPLTKNAVHTSLILKPGQQGQLDPRTKNLSLAVHPEVEQVMAWKNGIFNFNEVKLKDAMRQLSRWYDVEIIYEGKIPEMTFVGEMGRDLKLSQVLKGLNVMGVKFRIENKKLIVTQ